MATVKRQRSAGGSLPQSRQRFAMSMTLWMCCPLPCTGHPADPQLEDLHLERFLTQEPGAEMSSEISTSKCHARFRGLTEQAWLQQVQREDGPARQQRALASDTLSRIALQEFLGTLNKTGKPLSEQTTSGGLYLKYKACRNMDDPASRALGAENVDRLLAETSCITPSVRTALPLAIFHSQL
eukprot:symbB.v1.2.026792.t1/scaffold2527.1/size76866/6